MKRIVAVLVMLCMIFPFVACGEKTPSETGEKIALLETADKTSFTLSGTDALGRSFSAVNGNKEEKYVGLFYFLWIGQERSKQTDIYDNSKLLELLGEAYWAPYGSIESPADQYHFWGEPLFGYYNSADPWVMRRHMEMLTMAGIDFLVFDTTNQFTFDQVWQVLFPIMEEFASQGFAVPKIAFYTNTDSSTRITELYQSLYQPGKFKSLWFAPNGKPLIIGKNFAALSAEIQDFFDFRTSLWPGETPVENSFPWIDFSREQTVYPKGGATGGSVMSVSVSQHVGWPFSDSLQYKNVISASGIPYYHTNWGRGYTTASGVNNFDKIAEGANFEEQWQNALIKDPSTVFVTGWNEWIAVKFYEDITVTTGVPSRIGVEDRRVFLVDTVNEEFSRDIEPMKGGYGDNYYMQLIRNIRAYKGAGELAANTESKTIDVNGSICQWENVSCGYRDMVGDAVARNAMDAANKSTYTDNSNRNDIAEIRIAEDEENYYFLITCAEEITNHEEQDTSWMNLLLGIAGSADPSFGEYQYAVNRNPGNGLTSVERSKGGYVWEEVGTAKYSVNGKYLQIAVPKVLIGCKAGDTIVFKVTDHITSPSNIMDYYVSGDSAPIGRLSYTYKGI